MRIYFFKRFLLIFPTLLAIILLNFCVVQFAPGGPVESTIAALQGAGASNEASSSSKMSIAESYKAGRGMDEDMAKYIAQLYGFDKPAHERFFIMLKNYMKFDLGNSYFQNKSVKEMIIEKLPVSISLGLWSTLIIYLVSIPLGIAKAVRNGSHFDSTTSFVLAILYSIPSFLLGIFLLIFFAGDGAFGYFPISGITSANFNELTFLSKLQDYFWHITLPTITLTVSGFASLTLLTKNCFLEEMYKQYVNTARAKGLSENRVLYGHVFRNAMLIVITGIPETLIKILFTGAILTEIIYSLDGIGLMSYEAIIRRDYPVVFGTLYIFSFIALISNILTDICYTFVDPRINFEEKR